MNETVESMRTIPEFQEFHRLLDEAKGFAPDLIFNVVLLTAEVGELAQVLKHVRWKAFQLRESLDPGEAFAIALEQYRHELGQELADCLAYIFKIANNAGIDLEEAYLGKMAQNVDRSWTAPPDPK